MLYTQALNFRSNKFTANNLDCYNIVDSQILLDLHRQAHRKKKQKNTELRTTAKQLHSTGVP